MTVFLERCHGDDDRFRVMRGDERIGFVTRYPAGTRWNAEIPIGSAGRLVIPGDFGTPEEAAYALELATGSDLA